MRRCRGTAATVLAVGTVGVACVAFLGIAIFEVIALSKCGSDCMDYVQQRVDQIGYNPGCAARADIFSPLCATDSLAWAAPVLMGLNLALGGPRIMVVALIVWVVLRIAFSGWFFGKEVKIQKCFPRTIFSRETRSLFICGTQYPEMYPACVGVSELAPKLKLLFFGVQLETVLFYLVCALIGLVIILVSIIVISEKRR